MNISQLLPLEIPLVNKFYKANNARGKAKRNEQVWVVRKDDVIAACRIQVLDSHLLLVGLMVKQAHRNKGIGQFFLKNVIAKQSQEVFTFPYKDLVSWYSALGLKEKNKRDIPDEIQKKYLTYLAQGRDIVVMSSTPR